MVASLDIAHALAMTPNQTVLIDNTAFRLLLMRGLYDR
jgi:hypothetical protein